MIDPVAFWMPWVMLGMGLGLCGILVISMYRP